MRRVGDLEVDQDLAFEHRSWAFQRAGWVVMTLLILAALLGLLGPGPASSAKAEASGVALVGEYSRLVRASGETSLDVWFGAGAVRDGTVRLWIDREYLAQADLERVTPDPAAVELSNDRLIYVFRATHGEGGRVTFSLTPRSIGPWHARLGVEKGPSLAFRQFVFP